ncbi:hypothetical protein [Nannocystis radixulma]|uniref:Uncharacterized protein n=1 Tax=Nannocystis radixulma TaxID=2995305 RepID=A0ABT5B373_9BACT|nr:hypothetical protein [Nannocystis radixulma]MDC0668567.1 hypothetical protein [Nannocystis radixulma]
MTTDELWHRIPVELTALAHDIRALRAAGGLESTLQTLAIPPELHARLYR